MTNDQKVPLRLLIDSLLLVGATTGTRMLLVLSLLALAPFVDANDIASYDLFVIVSGVLVILLTLGLDSGLAISANAKTTARRARYIWISLALMLVSAGLLYFPLEWLMLRLQDNPIFSPTMFSLSFAHALITGATTLIFSFYRWTGRALTAALLVIVGSIAGVILGFAAFFAERTIIAFTVGLIAGNGFGLFLCAFYLMHDLGLPRGLTSVRIVRPLFHKMIGMSLPYMATSLLLMSRRTLDRGLIIAFGATSLLGPYALVSRASEIIAFMLAVPLSGFAPAFVKNYKNERYRQLARKTYMAYMVLSTIITLGIFAALAIYGERLLGAEAGATAQLLTALVAGNLFFSELFIAGFGYAIAQKPRIVPILSLIFIVAYLLTAGLPLMLGFGFLAIGFGFVVSAFLYSTMLIHYSEKLVPFGYPARTILAIRSLTLMIALISLSKLGFVG